MYTSAAASVAAEDQHQAGNTLALALGAVFLGGLNAVATVVTMFFLSVYGIVNLVAALEKLSGNPSWRPRVDVPWWLSLLGSLACFAVMMLIHLPVSLIAISIELLIWLWLKKLGGGLAPRFLRAWCVWAGGGGQAKQIYFSFQNILTSNQ